MRLLLRLATLSYKEWIVSNLSKRETKWDLRKEEKQNLNLYIIIYCCTFFMDYCYACIFLLIKIFLLQAQEKGRELSMLTVDNRQLQYRLDKLEADYRVEADKVSKPNLHICLLL